MNAMTEIQMEGVVERFDDLGALEEGWTTISRADHRAEQQTRSSVRRVMRSLMLALAVLLFFNSAGLLHLVQGLSIGPVQDTVIVMSETWHGEMERHGVAQILTDIRAQVSDWVHQPWDEALANDVEPSDPETENRATVLRGAVLDPSGT